MKYCYSLSWLLALLFFWLNTCPAKGNGLAPFDPDQVPERPDYGQEQSWIVLPESPDQYGVDVFWVYPTILSDETAWLMEISDPQLQEAATRTLSRQAGVFSGQANLYAPLYRQMNLAALDLDKEQQELLMAYGYQDIRQALLYYLRRYNRERPFILAGHSQGAKLLTELLVREWGKLGGEERLVAAYLIGWSVTRGDLQQNNRLGLCTAPKQTSCIISYNTVAPGMQSQAPTVLPGALVVNPLSWTTDQAIVSGRQNLGSVFFHGDDSRTVIPGFTSAQIIDGALVVRPTQVSLLPSPSPAFPQGVYHPYDYGLFYENIQANLAQRIQAFLTLHPEQSGGPGLNRGYPAQDQAEREAAADE
ncbi:DUF3089 domain-containing protein [Desulfogranum mediterraneum]|uniref:DUF3089 domain-containing protein n=1 Tax=Desulfogranum mediterraneum TaxID=160661 RepID=UPI0003FCCD56|nr:DUF3089 domain-containing protein [Desulfogranum mediterraneum]